MPRPGRGRNRGIGDWRGPLSETIPRNLKIRISCWRKMMNLRSRSIQNCFPSLWMSKRINQSICLLAVLSSLVSQTSGPIWKIVLTILRSSLNRHKCGLFRKTKTTLFRKIKISLKCLRSSGNCKKSKLLCRLLRDPDLLRWGTSKPQKMFRE